MLDEVLWWRRGPPSVMTLSGDAIVDGRPLLTDPKVYIVCTAPLPIFLFSPTYLPTYCTSLFAPLVILTPLPFTLHPSPFTLHPPPSTIYAKEPCKSPFGVDL